MFDNSTAPALPALATQLLTSTVRHGVTALGAVLITDGLMPANQANAFADVATGIAVAGLGMAWAFASKWMARQRLKQAITAPASTAN